jgi:hypothetical protein
MSKRDAQRIMHWCKNGDLVLKNKIKDTILRENLHEERFLDSTLSYLNKHQHEEQKHLVNKRLQFAKRKQRSQSLDRIGELHCPHESERNRSFSDESVHSKGNQNFSKKSFNAKVKWQKAISTVRFAIQCENGTKKTRVKPREAIFPSIVQSSPKSKPRCSGHASKTDHLVLPRIASGSARSINCLEDPRFLRLQQILSLGVGEDKDEERGRKSSRKTRREENEHGTSLTGRLRSHTYHL